MARIADFQSVDRSSILRGSTKIMISPQSITELAKNVVYIKDKTWDWKEQIFISTPGIIGPNPFAFGAGGYECYDPEDLVKLIEEAIVALNQNY